jgi:hypothetical protein
VSSTWALKTFLHFSLLSSVFSLFSAVTYSTINEIMSKYSITPSLSFQNIPFQLSTVISAVKFNVK